jgi:hypothetical protein
MSSTATQIDRNAALLILDRRIVDAVEALSDEAHLDQIIEIHALGRARAMFDHNMKGVNSDVLDTLRDATVWIAGRWVDPCDPMPPEYTDALDKVAAAVEVVQ